MSNWASRSLAKAIWPGPTSGGGAWDSLHAEEVSTAARSQKKAVADSATALSLPCLVSVHDGIGHDVLHRIHRLVVHPYLIVQVRSRGEPGRADLRDYLPTLHALAAHDEDLRAVSEARHQPEAVIHRDDVAVAFLPPHLGHDARRGRFDVRPHRCRHVDPLVWARQVKDRVDALPHERAREPTLGGHDRRRRGEARPVLG